MHQKSSATAQMAKSASSICISVYICPWMWLFVDSCTSNKHQSPLHQDQHDQIGNSCLPLRGLKRQNPQRDNLLPCAEPKTQKRKTTNKSQFALPEIFDPRWTRKKTSCRSSMDKKKMLTADDRTA